MLREGDRVPDVKLTGMDGAAVSPADFRGQKLVLYFYPKDDTTGCTREAQDFTALADAFEEAGTWILGVSKDSPAKHRKFTDKYGLKVRLASIKKRLGRRVVTGGRVLGVTALGEDLAAARARAYEAAHTIHFDGMQMRSDIGGRA